jgi:hypothetical protein
VAELPGLVLALSERYGRIRHIMLNIHAWDGPVRRLAVGPDVVRIGWFDTLDPALLVATTGRDNQVDLLVVPPDTTPEAAERAMATAADPTNLRHAPDILSAGATRRQATTTTDFEPYAVWDNEGGSAASGGFRRGHTESITRSRTGASA